MRFTEISNTFFKTMFVLVALVGLAIAQVDLPRPSPGASNSQKIGYTTASIAYSRPGVKDRKIWGGLVPHDKVWRAGANENTKIEFDTDVKINGQALPKGAYGLHILPGKKEWTFIFNTQNNKWGSYSYDKKFDALRVKSTPQSAPFLERMAYGFDNLQDESATFFLHWEKLKAGVKIEVEIKKTAIENIKTGLAKAKPDDQYAYLGAARFYWKHNIDRKMAMEWVNKSIKIKPIRANFWAKAEMLAEQKDYKGAKAAAKKAKESAVKDKDEAYVAIIDKAVAKWPKK